MKKKSFLTLSLIFAIIMGWLPSLAQQTQTELHQQYEQHQLVIDNEEKKIEQYIKLKENQSLPLSLTLKFNNAIESHEGASSFTEMDKQRQFNSLKQQYWRQDYFKKNPTVAGAYASIAAGSCDNGDFESNSFINYAAEWAIGSVNGYQLGDCGIFTADPLYQTDPIILTPYNLNGAIVEDFDIMNVGTDPLVTTGTLQQVWNGNHSARINSNLDDPNDLNGLGNPYHPNFSVSKLIKRVVLTEVDEEIFFNYALVMEDPGASHDGEKPTFVARVLDNVGNECDRICHAAYSADTFLLAANATGSIRYKQWNCESVQACGQIGDTVTLEFIQTDCGKGGHWGYAYVDDICDTCTGIQDSCNYQGSINLLPTDTCQGDNMQVCGTYELATVNCNDFSASQIRLYIQQNGATVAGPFFNNSPSGNSFCFAITAADFPTGTVAGEGFDFYVEIDFTIGGSTTIANDYNTNSGLNNDYIYEAECCPEFTLLTCCDLTADSSSANRSTAEIDAQVQKSLEDYRKALEQRYPGFDAQSEGCCDYCDYPEVAFPVFIYDETGTTLIDNSLYTISWSNDPSNNSAIGMVLPNESVVVTVSGPGKCVWTETFLFECCTDPGLPGFCCDTIDFEVDLDSLCNFDPCKYPSVQFPIQVSRDGVVIGTPEYSFQWSNGSTGSAISASLNQLPVSVTVTDNKTGCTTVGTYDIECDPLPCEIKAPENLSCSVTHGGQMLTWDAVSNAASYEIQLYYNDPDCCRDGGPGSITIPIPTNTNSYFINNTSDCFSWIVRSVCEDGTRSDWSNKSCSCGPVTSCLIKYPANLTCRVSSRGQTLSWDPIFNAVSYEIELHYNDPDCCPRGNPGYITLPIPVNGTSYFVNSTSDCFSWRVRSVCADGTTSKWSSSRCSCGFLPAGGFERNKKDGSSIENIENAEIYYSTVPNPASDVVTISFYENNNVMNVKNANIIITELTNREVYNSTISSNEAKQIDVSGFSKGVYIYRIIYKGKTLVTEKLIVE